MKPNRRHVVALSAALLSAALVAALKDVGAGAPSPIQAATIPVLLAGHDLIGQAQTGTGKTAAFLVTLMQRLLTREAKGDRRISDPRAVILAPGASTRMRRT